MPLPIPVSQVVHVTPETAADWLRAHDSKQRPRSKSLVDRYADMMLDGEWVLSSDALGFDVDGAGVNGQHRLAAVVASGVTCPFIVCWNLAPESFEVLDNGKRRTAGDVLAVEGIANARNLASVARIFLAYRNAGHFSARSPRAAAENLDVLGVVRDAPYLHEATTRADTYYRDSGQVLTRSIVGAVYAAAVSEGWPAADVHAFFDSVATGEGLWRGAPALALRTALVRAEVSGVLTRARLLGLVVSGLSAHLGGQPGAVVAWEEGSPMASLAKRAVAVASA